MVNDNSKLYITISYGKPSGGGGTTPSPSPRPTPNGGGNDIVEPNLFRAYAIHEFLHILKSQSIKALNSSIGMIGNLYGENFKQMKIQEGLERASILSSVIMGGISGLTMSGGNPLGALVGAGAVVVGQGVTWGFDRANFETSMIKQNRDIELLRQRSGLNSLYDNSRGTED